MAREGTSQDFFGLYRGIIPVTEVGLEPRHVLLNTRLLTRGLGFGAGPPRNSVDILHMCEAYCTRRWKCAGGRGGRRGRGESP